ncbi:DinB family protein [Candidatus Acetothermia bacterium]|nr:DinB family protein [Candidatus Acetothermia bacterium]MBI3643766.1 DinB family protein [Candidatus Acetothermia bacterium]
MAKELLDVKPQPGINIELGLLLAILEENTRDGRDDLKDFPEEAILWQPFPDGHSIGAILLHIACAESRWFEEVVAQRVRDPELVKRLRCEEIDQFSVKWVQPTKRPLSWYYEQQDAIRKRTLEIIHEAADPAAISTLAERKYEYTLRWVIYHIIQHEAYHIGQAVLCGLQHERQKSLKR